MKIIQSDRLPPDYTILEIPKFSPHRSKRITKKLWKRMKDKATPGWLSVMVVNGAIYCHPSIYRKIFGE